MNRDIHGTQCGGMSCGESKWESCGPRNQTKLGEWIHCAVGQMGVNNDVKVREGETDD